MRLRAPFYPVDQHIGIDLPGARALFTTRRGGVSSGPFESLNLGRLTEDQRSDVERNRELLAKLAGVRFAHGRQVHGTTVMRPTEPTDETAMPPDADGQATTVSGIGPLVLTADCLPIAIAGAGSLAMIHAGWRGLAGGVIREGVRAVKELGGRPPLVAAIGPGAGGCCYEVGEEVHEAFGDYGGVARNGRNLDLKAVARIELARSGVGEIHDVGLCTICSDPSLFFSHRRDRGITGRQGGVAWLV